MPGKFWDKDNIRARLKLNDGSAALGPSAGLVQQHFVEARLAELYTRNKDLEKKVADALMRGIPGLKSKGDKWLEAYKKINRSLQSAALTINFKADRWFTTENKFESYAQQYQRSGFEKDKAIFKGDKQNPAFFRAVQDDKVTFPVMSAGGQASPQRGLMPGRQGQARIETQMKFNADTKGKDLAKMTKAEILATDKEQTRSQNPYFNPKTKQIFAGLNYGRRPHGSNIDYGTSHFVLHEKFKVNAIYFGGDTFFDHEDASKQAAFGTLGALAAWADADLLSDIIRSCYDGGTLDDTKNPKLLIEGHIFSELPFSGNITTIYLDAVAHSEIHNNARTFAAKHGAKLVVDKIG